MCVCKKIAAGLTALAFTISSGNAVSEEQTVNSSEPTYFSSTSGMDVSDAAEEYSVTSGNVGIILHYKPWDGAPPIGEVAKPLVDEFTSRGQSVQYFVHELEGPGFAVSFVTQTGGKGPMTGKEAIKKVDYIIQLNEEYKKYEAYEKIHAD